MRLMRDRGHNPAVPPTRSGQLLVSGTNFDHSAPVRARIFPGAREATACYRSAPTRTRRGARDDICLDERRGNRLAGARRANAECRRYATHNGLSGLAVLTFVDAVDRRAAWAAWARFSRRVRRSSGRFPWIVSAEDHIRHGTHLNWLLPPGDHHEIIAMWPYGVTSQPRTGSMPWLTPTTEEVRALVRYVTKEWEAAPAQTRPGQHRYSCARGFTPEFIEVSAPTFEDLYSLAVEYFGEKPSWFWSSRDVPDWGGPSTVLMRWR